MNLRKWIWNSLYNSNDFCSLIWTGPSHGTKFCFTFFLLGCKSIVNHVCQKWLDHINNFRPILLVLRNIHSLFPSQQDPLNLSTSATQQYETQSLNKSGLCQKVVLLRVAAVPQSAQHLLNQNVLNLVLINCYQWWCNHLQTFWFLFVAKVCFKSIREGA